MSILLLLILGQELQALLGCSRRSAHHKGTNNCHKQQCSHRTHLFCFFGVRERKRAKSRGERWRWNGLGVCRIFPKHQNFSNFEQLARSASTNAALLTTTSLQSATQLNCKQIQHTHGWCCWLILCVLPCHHYHHHGDAAGCYNTAALESEFCLHTQHCCTHPTAQYG